MTGLSRLSDTLSHPLTPCSLHQFPPRHILAPAMSRSALPDFSLLLDQLREACLEVYGARLISLLVFGSVGRRTPQPGSDIDLLLVVTDLPKGRLQRVREFLGVESKLRTELNRTAVVLSPVIKSPNEAEEGSPLFLDMTEDALMLHDRNGFMEERLKRLKARLERLGARRIWRGNSWHWDLKPDYTFGDVFEL
jgi:uncharacterized protein